eukprot:1325429-Pleurochrysis_carterae.AAC.2
MDLSVVSFSTKGDADVPADAADSDLPWVEAFTKSKEAQRTEAERHADGNSLRTICVRYGEMSERLLHMLLTFDALFAFRKVMRERFSASQREEQTFAFAQARACTPITNAVILVRKLSNVRCSCATADRAFWEQLEVVTLGRHKSQ